MEIWKISQFVHVFVSFAGTGIFAGALISVSNWPSLRGRQLLLAAISVLFLSSAGYLAMGLFQLIPTLNQIQLPQTVIPGVYMLLALLHMVGQGLLLGALISLASSLRGTESKSQRF